MIKTKSEVADLISNVIYWADERGLLSKENAPVQAQKIIEELGETMRADLKNNKKELIDGIGDTMVTLIIYAAQHGIYIGDALEAAWNEIKDRKGKTTNGTFIKGE